MVQLEPEQEELLSLLCKAARSSGRRESFSVYYGMTTQLGHHGLPGGSLNDFHPPDIDLLARHGLLYISGRGRNGLQFDVTAEGFAYWEELKGRQPGAAVVEQEVRSYLDNEDFRERFKSAHDKWTQAEKRLWGADSHREHTTIGHECREALQLFAASFATEAGVEPSSDIAKTVDTLRRSLDALAERLPSTMQPMLDALLVYWGTASDLVQRQEHGTAKEGGTLGWEDSRLVVFQTAVVMFELARASDRARRTPPVS